ncbi:uncharacterized protein LOC128670418 [Plodia interpunctella]|uniref:uncharacterized protein LOC128670418 n=1 Tax=Plodia interpunctella TaxID=58824 RepID=UPI002368523F|nr:uncharacterized protein LOC128670418 [Plodia interpunctella]
MCHTAVQTHVLSIRGHSNDPGLGDSCPQSTDATAPRVYYRSFQFYGTNMAALLRSLWRSSQAAVFFTRTRNFSSPPLVFSEEVLRAKSKNKPIVALESTIITHGMPYPKNLETALEVEEIIRERGATPATIAILKGQLTIGLTKEQLEYLSQAEGVVKASRRDLAPVAAVGGDGATTVAGTIIAAQLADIPVFVTGGIGGVHREGESTMDVSADLTELGRSNTLVVCSGIKSILDIGRTLEFLETQGVCVCSFGESSEFPAFYTPRSGHRAPHRVPDAGSAARLLRISHTYGLNSGIVIAVPIPKEYAMDEDVIEGAIELALEDAKKKGIRGKEITPFILAAVAAATGGSSLSANIALIKNNAKVGADIAVEFKKLNNVDNFNIEFLKGASPREGDVLVIGGANVDKTYRVIEDNVKLDGSTHPCVTEQCPGGVGRNIAEVLWKLRKGKVRLLTAIGDDSEGRFLLEDVPGMILNGCVVEGGRTPTYAAVLDKAGECRLGLGDMALYDHISKDMVEKHIEVIKQAPMVVLDGNVPKTTMEHVMRVCDRLQKPVFFEPTDTRKAVKPLQYGTLTYASPNLAELKAMANYLNPGPYTNSPDALMEVIELAKRVSSIRNIVVTLSSNGVLLVKNSSQEVHYYPAELVNTIVNVSGAGDCFAGGFIHGILSGSEESVCIAMGYQAAKAALMSRKTVPNDITIDNNTQAKCSKLKFKV